MPEGDTIYRTADVLRRVLEGDRITDARGRPGGAHLERVVGTHVRSVRTMGKHLLIDFDNGLSLHTHLRMNGSWHRYRPGEPWRRDATGAVAVLETVRAVAVCFDAPTVELLDTRALSVHPALSGLGPDLLDEGWDPGRAYERLVASEPGRTVAEALLDQRVAAGIGNVYRSEVLFIERIDPFRPAGFVTRDEAGRVFQTARQLLRANTGGGERITMPDALGAPPGAWSRSRSEPHLWVYGRAGRPCRRCAAEVLARSIGSLPRRLYWCPSCQRAQTSS